MNNDQAVNAMKALLERVDDPQTLRNMCLELVHETATTRLEEQRLWAIIHNLQHENSQLRTKLALHTP